MTTPPTVASTIAALTLEEKASLLSGSDFWHTTPVERLGVRKLMLTDGPHGLRKQSRGGDHLALGDSVPATCFPPAVGLGCSWDVELVRRIGAAIGAEAAAEDVAVVLGPGINIKRSPLCGRNFEYFSEDPVVAGALGAAMVQGLQSQGVGASLKHFAANNQEYDRMRVSADVDPRPLREIYLRAFQRVVTDARPWTVMCSYNRINGVPASQDPWLLTTVLREEWGFDGLVVSDWGAVDDRVAALAAGLDLQMPGANGVTDAQVVVAVTDGTLDPQRVDEAAGRVLRLVRAAADRGSVGGSVDVDAQHALAREAAGRSIVLLKNEGDVLPLSRDANVAVLGAFGAEPRYQGAGSSMINPTRLDSALDEMRSLATGTVSYAPGFGLAAQMTPAESAQLRDEAVGVAADADVVVVFLGLPARLESEGYDRDDIDLPAAQLELLDAVLDVNPNAVVVLSNGGVVAVPFNARVPALVEGWLLGQAGGGAIADVVFGAVNPSGKLIETVPLRLADTPAYLDFPGESSHVRYGEGLFVGYRWYDARDIEVAYPFGHGLSYTTFEYGEATAVVNSAGDVDVHVSIGNVGPVAGREIVQVYTSLPGGRMQRPPRELKAFASVALDAGEVREVVMTISRSDLAYWDIRTDSWVVEGGAYAVEVAASSRDVRSTTRVDVDGDAVVVPLSRDSSIAEVMAHPVAGPILQAAVAAMMGEADGTNSVMPEGVETSRMLESIPIGRVDMFASAGGMDVDPTMIDALIEAANASPDAHP
ncbi:glycoside hydrolase family 3 C-terminal domain-containing protein [Mycobacterium antarcticum]|uniref:glycoside hydrolase family 3 C-terminal domain-containing protein n=1 Tax=Mycolicibacterium sp. TUM20984 TaxID=3023368 RepID=UPI0023A13393|nr:glycoside hydrolase family 3 C-terminal domain-containing protein [Mycolicibacterium sp. TUM20984]GLP81346.1 glycosyl hydrolase [Mycolicibacterium sp. TUM20984]